MIRLLISGGPGSGCTSTAIAVGKRLDLPVLDSDSYFHRPTDPPFQEQYTPQERREILGPLMAAGEGWILAGSVATWGLDLSPPSHGIFLNIPGKVRLKRLARRQGVRFATRITPGGDMQEEHESFMEWAARYEERKGEGRNLETDRAFLEAHCGHFLELSEEEPVERVISKIMNFIAACPA